MDALLVAILASIYWCAWLPSQATLDDYYAATKKSIAMEMSLFYVLYTIRTDEWDESCATPPVLSLAKAEADKRFYEGLGGSASIVEKKADLTTAEVRALQKGELIEW